MSFESRVLFCSELCFEQNQMNERAAERAPNLPPNVLLNVPPNIY